MKRFLYIALALALCVSLAYAATETAKPAATDKQGIAAAVALTKITGIAISPMLGVGVVGAYDYFTCPKGKADQLPWYAQLKFWLPALLLVGLVAFKDTAGAMLPPGWKKPLDVAETVESKISGLVAAGAVVPSIAAIFHSTLASSADPQVMQAGILGISLATVLNILTIPLAVTAFVLVWLVGHVINVLILISPWGAIDAGLKAARTALIGTLTAIHFINPWWGAGVSLIIIVIAYFIAGWSFRLMVFGTVFTWDFVSRRRKRFTPDPKTNWMFTGRKLKGTPIRTYGKVAKADDGTLRFDYRPWLFLPACTITLPEGRYAIGRGLFYPEIMTVEGEKTKTLLSMPPRYKKHEEEIGQIYGIAEIRDTGLLKGLKAIWRWCTGGYFGKDSPEAAAAASASA
jgi:hypothetical protein